MHQCIEFCNTALSACFIICLFMFYTLVVVLILLMFFSVLFREILMNVKCLDQRPPDNVSIQRSTTSSPIQCSNVCLYNNDCTLVSFSNDLCILYNQTAIGSTYIMEPGVKVWERTCN